MTISTGSRRQRILPHHGRRIAVLVVGVLLLVPFATLPAPALAEAMASPTSVYFTQTGHTLSGDFFSFWRDHGGLPIFGYPLSEPFNQDGLTVQYFERAVFEAHPGNSAGWTVELRLLGDQVTDDRRGTAPFQPVSAPAASDGQCTFMPATGHRLCGSFLAYWRANGGLPVFGYPLSEAFTENGLTVQYFERARFEAHPENAPPYQVELGRLGADAAVAAGVDQSSLPQPSGVPLYSPAFGLATPTSVQLSVSFHAQQDPNWCDPADLEMWLQASGAPLPPGNDATIQAALWSYEISHNDGYSLDQWSASPYAVAVTFDHFSGRSDVGDATFTDPSLAGAAIAWSVAVARQPVIALVDNGTHYLLITGVTLGPGGVALPPLSVTIDDPWTIAPTRDGYPAMGQGTTWDWATFTQRFTPDALTDPGIWSGKWVLIASGLPLGS